MRSLSRSRIDGQRLAREVVQVGGAVARRVAVRRAAVAPRSCRRRRPGRALPAVEHHVLEEVRDAGGAVVLVPRAGAEEDVRAHDRRRSGPAWTSTRSPFSSVCDSTGSVTRERRTGGERRDRSEDEKRRGARPSCLPDDGSNQGCGAVHRARTLADDGDGRAGRSDVDGAGGRERPARGRAAAARDRAPQPPLLRARRSGDHRRRVRRALPPAAKRSRPRIPSS